MFVSSAYSRILHSLLFGVVMILMLGLLLIAKAYGSVIKLKSNEESGQPCLTECSKVNSSVSSPLHLIMLFALIYSNLIQFMKVLPNPNLPSTPHRKL